MLFILLNGVASGFPWVVIGSALTLWLQQLGLTRTAIGFFGSVTAMYALNWMWAPLLDRVRLPLLGALGQRRSWLLLCQSLLLLLIALMGLTDPRENLIWLSLLSLGVAAASATQDVAIDAYRIDALTLDEKNKLPATAALATSGWWLGYGLFGAAALYVASFGFSWNAVYGLLAACMLIFIAVTLCLDEPKSSRFDEQAKTQSEFEAALGARISRRQLHGFIAWWLTTIVAPLKDFFTRFGYVALLILLFIFSFKIGEAFLGRMSLVFYKEIGFTTAQIATYSKLGGTLLTVVFSIVASIIAVQYGLIRGLFIAGVAMAATNLIFAYLAQVGPNTTVFAAAILLDNFTSAFATVSFVAFISHLTNRAYTASQYALMASIGNFGRTVLAGGSGLLVDYLHGNWQIFFVITTLMVLPGLALLYWIGRKLAPWFHSPK